MKIITDALILTKYDRLFLNRAKIALPDNLKPPRMALKKEDWKQLALPFEEGIRG
jgi:hypothetical protein